MSTYRTDPQAVFGLDGPLASIHLAPSRGGGDPVTYPTDTLMGRLIAAACTWDDDGRGLAASAAVHIEVQARDIRQLQQERDSARRDADTARRDLARFRDSVREAAIEVQAGHDHHIDKDALNGWLRELGLEPVPIKWTVTVNETATRSGYITVEAKDEDAAVQEAYSAWENDDSKIEWDNWDDQSSDTDDYEVEEVDE